MPLTVLTRIPLAELETVEDKNLTSLTMLAPVPERPPTEPTERPWPPEQRPPVKVMFYYGLERSRMPENREKTYSSRVNGNAIVLVLDVSTRDVDV